MADATTPPPETGSKLVCIRLQKQMIRDLKALANRRGTRYQTLIKQALAAALKEYRRSEGAIPPGRV